VINKCLRLPGLLLRLLAEDRSCRAVPVHNNGGVLLVKLDAIGDFIVWLGCSPQLRRRFVRERLILVCNQAVAHLAAASGHFDAVILLQPERFKTHWPYRLRMLRQIRREGCRTAIQPTYSRRFLLGESIIRCSGARKRIGSLGDNSNMSALEKRLADRWYTQLLPANPAPLSELERHQEFLHHLGVPSPSIELASLPSAPWPEGVAKPSHSYLVLFPGAGAALRRWPPDRFAALAIALYHSHGLQPVICGSAADTPLGDAIAAHLANLAVINLCGATSLLELIGVIGDAQLLVANETSASHIAAATGTPSVCLLGGGHFGRFMPYPAAAPQPHPVAVYQSMPCFHCNWQCIHPLEPEAPAPCLDAITVEMALQAAQQALALRPRQMADQ
jgi:ADP-heptose:LPS heptosyltransferase